MYIMTDEKIRVTLDFLNRNRKVTFDITGEDFHNKTLSKALIDHTINHAMQSAISMPIEVKTGTAGVTSLKLSVPSREELKIFIKAQPDFEYTFEAIINHFLGDKQSSLSKADFGNWDKAMRVKVNRVIQEIESEEKGHFEGKHIGGHKKVFKFIKDSGGEIKQNTQTQQEDLTNLLA
jgi:hypothetical protein